jgi:hypothetical protein
VQSCNLEVPINKKDVSFLLVSDKLLKFHLRFYDFDWRLFCEGFGTAIGILVGSTGRVDALRCIEFRKSNQLVATKTIIRTSMLSRGILSPTLSTGAPRGGQSGMI